jgi:hypothetical protein
VAAFLRRRWILLSCAVVLLACSVVDMAKAYEWDHPKPRFWFFSVQAGDAMLIFEEYQDRFFMVEWWKAGATWHQPELGDGLRWNRFENGLMVSVPLWLPLSAVLGWLVIREFRWREKRAREAAE